MRRYSEILRFRGGVRRQLPSPEVMVSYPPAGTPVEAGEQLVVLVDLLPMLPHRSREIRTVAVETYWASSGSVVARLRRALAAANRYLVHVNETLAVGEKSSGCLTCLVCREEELFLGQVGPGYAFVSHPDHTLELFPRRDRLLIPLGGTLPPRMHIGFTLLEDESTVLLATTLAAESQARDRWQQLFAEARTTEELVARIDQVMAAGGADGSFVLLREPLASPPPVDEPPIPWAKITPPPLSPPPAEEVVPEPEEAAPEESAPRRRVRLPSVKPYFRQAGQLLLPGPVAQREAVRTHVVPQERASVMGGLALLLTLLVAIITAVSYVQFGGVARAQELLVDARKLRSTAYATQNAEEWHRLLDLTSQILTIDPGNEDARQIRDEAQSAIDSLESAALLDAHPLVELGVSPIPRRLLVVNGWVYVLNPAADVVLAYQLNENGTALVSDVPTVILKRGQSLFGETVGQLVDLAWVNPSAHYRDGAVFIYGEEGWLYMYEPTLGLSSITRQHLQGPLETGAVTSMGTFGEKVYLVQRRENQLLTYEPVNGVYDLPRNYFAPGAAPRLQTALDVAIDGRVYVLLGDGKVQAYYAGTADPSFEVRELPDTKFKPTVMAVEADPDMGLLYLGDAVQQRIVVLNKQGVFQHQFRLPEESLQQLEALAVTTKPHNLYLIAGNKLYAAPIPEFVAP